jgi:hypothetical protein
MMVNHLIKLAEELDRAGETRLADQVDGMILSFASENSDIADKISDKVNEMGIGGRARRGATKLGLGSTAILIGYSGKMNGVPGNAGDTTAKSKAAVEDAIEELGMSGKVTVTEVYQDVLSIGLVTYDSRPPESYNRPAKYQVDVVTLSIQ